MNNTLVADRVFQSLSVPLQPEQEAELEKSLLQEGCKEPVIAWNGVIIWHILICTISYRG